MKEVSTGYPSIDKPWEKYYREKPVREFDLNQTLYNTIKFVNKDNLSSDAIGFLGTNITYRELFKRVDRLADAYYKEGIREGDVVALCTINMPIVQESLLALSKLGATSQWIDLRIKGKELIKNINESHCKLLVVFEGVIDTVNEIIDEIDVIRVVVVSPKDYLNPFVKVIAKLKDKGVVVPKDKRYIKYCQFVRRGNFGSEVISAKFKKDRPSIIVQSSGSTGKAKQIVHTEYNFNSVMYKEAYTDLPFSVGKSLYVAIPSFIIYGLCGSIYAALVFGLKAEMTPYVSETTLFDDVGKYDFAAAAPIHYRYLYNKLNELQGLKMEAIVRKRLSRVKCFISGGDKISVQELLRMQQYFEVPVINGYGNNELTGGAVISPLYASKPDSVGIPMKGIMVKAFDINTYEKLENGNEGEICINSDSIFECYLNNETEKVKQMHSDGLYWIHTGDLGYIDEDGYVYITGRTKRLIKREAFKIAPDTIENILMTVENVRDCVVVGVPDTDHEGSQVPMAYIEVDPESGQEGNAIIETVRRKCINELPDYEVPKYIAVIEKIPYKNTKHNFKLLETMGKEHVENLVEE